MAKQFVYRGAQRTSESISRKTSEGTRDYDSVYKSGYKVFKPKEGENCVRVLPSTWEEPDWDMTIHSHYDVGPDNARYLCSFKMKGEPCAVCDARAAATDEDEADKLQAGKGAVCWIIDRDNEKEGPQLWSIPFTKVRNEIHSRSIDKKTRAPILIDDPEEGFDVVFNRKGTGQTTGYSGVEVVRDPSPIHENEALQAKWLAYIAEHPLPSVLNWYEPDYIEKVLFGRATAKKDDAEAEAPATSRRRPAAPPDEEVVEDTPVPARRRASAPPPEEDVEVPVSDRASRRRALLNDTPPDDEPPFDPETGEVQEAAPVPRGSRRAARETPVEEETPVASARRSLERLKPARGR